MSNEVIVAFITGVLGPILIIITNKILAKTKKKPDLIKDTLKESELILTKLEHIRDEFKVDRIWLAQFHNGGNYYPTGKSIAKFSFVHESVLAGVPSIQANFQNIPVNLFTKSINELLTNDIIEIPDFKDETIATHGLKYIAEENGTKSCYLFAIKSIDEKFVGVLGLDFTKKKVKLDSQQVNLLSNQAAVIGGVIMNKI